MSNYNATQPQGINTYDDAKESTPRLGEHAEALRDDLSAVKDDATAAAAALRDRVQQDAERVVDAAKAGGERARHFHEGMCEQVAKRPTTSVLLALGAGVLLGKFLAR